MMGGAEDYSGKVSSPESDETLREEARQEAILHMLQKGLLNRHSHLIKEQNGNESPQEVYFQQGDSTDTQG